MKNLSSSMLEALNSSNPKYILKFLFYPKIWDGENKKYIFAEPVDITPFIKNSGAIKWKLDNEGYGIWNNAGLSMEISNRAEIFNKENYLIYGSRVDIFAGVQTKVSKEYVKIFRGFIMRPPSYNPSDKLYLIDLSGEMACLDYYSAQELSIKRENILLSSRPAASALEEDKDYLTFSLPDMAVGSVLKLVSGPLDGGWENATELKEVNEYEVSSLNSYKYPAKITLLSPLAPGYGLWASYIVWHTDKSIEWIVSKSMQLYGALQTEIEDVNYEGKIEAFFNQPSDMDFLRGETDYAEVSSNRVTLPSTFLKDANYDWTVIAHSGPALSLSPNSVTIPGTGSIIAVSSVSAPCTQAYGTWEGDCDTKWNEKICQYYYFVADSPDGTLSNGYYFCHTKYDFYRIFFAFFKTVNGVPEQVGMVWRDLSDLTDSVRYRICRYEDGSVRFMYKALSPVPSDWYDFGIVFTDNQFKTSSHHIVNMVYYGNNHITNMRLSPQAAVGPGEVAPFGNYYSPVIDGGSRLIGWRNFTASDEPNNAQSLFYVRSKETQESQWGDWQNLLSGDKINQTGRYLQLKWAALSDASQTYVPTLKYWQVDWEAKGVNIAMINSGSMSVLDIIKELACLSGYQIGFDSEGKFFFKSRPALTKPVMKLSKKDIISIENINGGSDKLYNRVSVNFGNYNCVVDDISTAAPRPNLIDKYGIKELSLASGSLLPAQNANLARACAPGIYKEASKLKKRAAVICRFLPQIELGDVIELDCVPELSGNMMVEGLEFDFNSWTLRLDLCSWEADNAK